MNEPAFHIGDIESPVRGAGCQPATIAYNSETVSAESCDKMDLLFSVGDGGGIPGPKTSDDVLSTTAGRWGSSPPAPLRWLVV